MQQVAPVHTRASRPVEAGHFCAPPHPGSSRRHGICRNGGVRVEPARMADPTRSGCARTALEPLAGDSDLTLGLDDQGRVGVGDGREEVRDVQA